jgi:hypothetical protein
MALWNTIAAARLTAGRLWLPRLSLDMMARDWATFTIPFDWDLTDDQTYVGNKSWDNFLSGRLTICYPDSWDADASYATAMRLTLTPMLRFTNTGDLPTVNVRLTDGDDEAEVTSAGSAAVCTITKTYLGGALPTGPTSETMQVEITGGPTNTTVFCERDMGDRGCDSHIQFYLTSGTSRSTQSGPGGEGELVFAAADEPTASETWEGVTIRIIDAGVSGKYKVCLKKSDGSYYWHLLATAEPP